MTPYNSIMKRTPAGGSITYSILGISQTGTHNWHNRNMKVNQNITFNRQYRARLWISMVQHCLMEIARHRMMLAGIRFLSHSKAFASAMTSLGDAARSGISLPSSSQRYSFGWRSGLSDGHGITSSCHWRRNARRVRSSVVLLDVQTVLSLASMSG